MDVYSIILILNKTNLKENVQHKQWKYVKTNYSRLFFEKKKSQKILTKRELLSN